MNDRQKLKFEKYGREIVFMNESIADFALNSPGKKTVDLLAAVVAEIEALDIQKISGASGAQMRLANKDDALDDLLGLMRRINRAANAMDDEIPNIEEMFRMPRNRGNLSVLNTARQFKSDAAAHEDAFIEYGLPPTFLSDMESLINSIESNIAARDAAVEMKGGATGGLIDAFRRAGKHSRKLNSIVRNKYADNAQKLAAWTIASHLQAAPRKPAPTA